MSLEPSPAGGPSHRHIQFILILALTVVGWAAVIVLSVIGQADAAKVIGTLWGATCALLVFWKPEQSSSQLGSGHTADGTSALQATAPGAPPPDAQPSLGGSSTPGSPIDQQGEA